MTFKFTIIAAALLAASATIGTAATITEQYNATSAIATNPLVAGRHDHSLIIMNGVGAGIGSDFDFAPSGTYTIFDDGTASLAGRVESQDDPTSGFDVFFAFDQLPPGAGSSFKSGAGSSVQADTYLIDMTGGMLLGFGALAGLDLDARRMPADYTFATQVGTEANNKNKNYGMAFWMSLHHAGTCTVCASGPYSGVNKRAADMNVDLTPFDRTPDPSPVPLPAAGLLLVGGLGALAALRRRRRG